MDTVERESLTVTWVRAMKRYAAQLEWERRRDVELVRTLTVLDLSNLFALLNLVQVTEDGETTIELTSALYSLLRG